MNRAKKRQPRIIDVEPVEVETTALVVAPRVRTAQRPAAPPRAVPAVAPPMLDAAGRLDIAAYRLASEYALPWAEVVLGVPGLAAVLAPWAEYWIAEAIPGVNVFNAAPKPRRRLR